MGFAFGGSLDMQSKGFKLLSLNFWGLLLIINQVSCETYTINTNEPSIRNTISEVVSGSLQEKIFQAGPNGATWKHKVASFIITDASKSIFETSANTVHITGNNSLSLNFTGNIKIRTTLDVSGKSLDGVSNDTLFILGGFVRTSNSCCVLGAGPGAAYSYHGAGHGGRGGGFYQDRNSSRYYSWEYSDVNYLLGGSTSTAMFDSKPGSGGGAIEIIAHNGNLTIDTSIRANGYTSRNTTSEDHCAGGSSGGLIRLHGANVVFTSKGKLLARGGSSGYSQKNHNNRCGDGGGGGVIQVFSSHDHTAYTTDISKLDARGGVGLARGEKGDVFLGFQFDHGVLDINTTECTIKWAIVLLHQGSLTRHTFRTPDNKMTIDYKVCSFEFSSSVYIGTLATVRVLGLYSLRITSKNGDVEIMTDITLANDVNGGFDLKSLQGQNEGPGNVTNCSVIGLYENNFDVLIGGSICNKIKDSKPVDVKGGGAIEINAPFGDVIIGKTIRADGSSNTDNAGAMGGIIRLVGKQVHLKSDAFLSAKSSSTGKSLASGGLIQINSAMDIPGRCHNKFDVSGGSSGFINIMVSAKMSYQAQFIQDGDLLINTTPCIWSHRTMSNNSIGCTQHGSLENGICSFSFQTPIIVNGSTVTLSGQHALSIESTQGMYFGKDLIMDSSMIAKASRFMGGYCVAKESDGPSGAGPGKGYPGIGAGGGHGGRGGLFKEHNNIIYGNTYGVKSLRLIGGSTGTSNHSGIVGCGGGAIRIKSDKNLTIDAAIKANGYSKPLFEGTVSGSSGGSIFLDAKYVILKDGAVLEAKGSDGRSPSNEVGGGGGGGVISVNASRQLIGKEPNVTIATAGGKGSVPGESGVVIINGDERYQKYNPVVQSEEKFIGCRRILTKPADKHTMLEHEALPSQCVTICTASKKVFALINAKVCYCTNDDSAFETVSSSLCKKPCRASYNYLCGGDSDDVCSVYKTGVTLPETRHPDEASKEFQALDKVNITAKNSKEVVDDLYNLTTGSVLNKGDTQVATSIITKLATQNVLQPKNTQETKTFGQAIVQTASKLLGSSNTDNWKNIDQVNDTSKEVYSPNNLLESMETIGINLGQGLQPKEQVAIESNHLVMGIERQDLSTDIKDNTFPHYDKLTEKWKFEDTITIPKESVMQLKKQGANHTTVVFVLYNGINDALQRNLAKNKKINSRVLSLKFDRTFTKPLEKPVVISLTKKESWDNLTDPTCSFLEFKTALHGEWSSQGCKRTSSAGDSKVKCECNHLTNFAILMQIKEIKLSQGHQQALQLITYIGCGISLFGLALTLATFLSLETLASERTSIHKNLVIAIGLAQIIFLAGIDAVYNPIACKIVALSLHYLYMAAFTWMCCEGIHLYTKVIEVFSSETSKMKYYYMLGWGAPLIIVIISAASRMSGYGTETACWISIKDGLIWAFVGPVLVIMCINFVVMVMVIKVILASVSSIQTPGNTSQVKAGLKGMVVLLPLLGLTWVFGLMAVNEKTVAFQYVFAILNSLQGLFIFAFHCIGNSEVRVAYKRLHEKRTLAKMPEHSLSSGNHHKEFKRRMTSRETNSTGDEDIIVTKAIRSVSDVKLSGGHDHVAMQTFGDADSGRWSLNCPSPDPPSVSYQPAVKTPRRDPQSPPVIINAPCQTPATPRGSYRNNRNNVPMDKNRLIGGEQGQQGYQRF